MSPFARAATSGRIGAMDRARDEWGEWMAAAQDGHGGAYRRLLGELRQWLTRYYARRLPPALVDDAVQDTLIAIHEKRHTYDPTRPFRPWLAAVARHKWIDRLRAMARERTDSLPDDIATGDHEEAVVSATVLRELMSTLKTAQADAIRLVKLEGYSIEEASAKTGQSESLVKVNIHRGLRKLAAVVRGRGDDQ
jgi:RNA polymerase sigma factor (sigma-70 family)